MPTLKLKCAFWLLGGMGTFLVVWYLWVSKGTPSGQPPLTSLTQHNLDRFRNDFNAVKGKTRLVLLLSPT